MEFSALLHSDEASGMYLVDIPDLPEVITEGANPDEAAANAREAISAHIELLRELGRPVPTPGSYESISIAV